VTRLIEELQETIVEVSITGASRTGEESVPRGSHYTSQRARSPFVAVNWAALPSRLIESELFGIERGVAAGVERRTGQFESVHGGALFLHELADLSPTAQAILLHILQKHLVERVGGRRIIPVDLRVLAGTNY
jgi:transcriptional regulator with PAS, ATPase and Fis domain